MTQGLSLGWEDPNRKWHATPVFLPGNFHGGRILATVHGATESQTLLSVHAHARTHTHTHTMDIDSY